jgi:hypothetical protein
VGKVDQAGAISVCKIVSKDMPNCIFASAVQRLFRSSTSAKDAADYSSYIQDNVFVEVFPPACRRSHFRQVAAVQASDRKEHHEGVAKHR